MTIELAQAGGKVLYVFLSANDEIHRIPVTGHLHTLKEWGRVQKEDFMCEVESILDEFNLGSRDLDLAMKECLRLMRKDRLIE